MRHYISPDWDRYFAEKKWADFEAIWKLPSEPLDGANTSRGGWSLVGLFQTRLPGGREKRLIIKKQSNHTSRTLWHPIRGIPTFEKELANIFRYQRAGIPTIQPVFFSKEYRMKKTRAVLITEYLDGYFPADSLPQHWKRQKKKPSREERNRLIGSVAAQVRTIHRNGYVHNCLYPKHLFVSQREGRFEVRIIDLEKSKRGIFRGRRKVRDLETLYRRTGEWSRTDKLRFLLSYCGVERLDRRTKNLGLRILKRTQKKQKP
jgi:hypothetical protein